MIRHIAQTTVFEIVELKHEHSLCCSKYMHTEKCAVHLNVLCDFIFLFQEG